jgi:hypothetical protein
MSSKFSVLAILLATAMSVSCGLKLNDEPPVPVGLDFRAGEKAKCLSEVLPLMSHFVEGNSSAPAVEQIWDCFRSALTVYGSFVRGREDERYSARELATFFEMYFLKDIKINDRLLDQVMKLKRVFVGGDDKYLTRDELNKLIAGSQELKIICLKMLPYMKVFSFNWKIGQVQILDNNIRYFDEANLAIQDAAKDLAAMIAKNDKSYAISNFVVLLEEISKLYGTTWPFLESLQKAMPLVYKLKRTLAGGDEEVIAHNEWKRFILLGARGYVQFLRYYYFIKINDQVGTGPEVIYFAKSIDDLFSYLGDMVAEKPNGVFTRGELLEVLLGITQFVPEVRVSDALLYEAMKLKRLFFGGNLDFFTPQDFIRARAKVDTFRSLTEKLLLYLPLYSFSWNSQLGAYPENQRYFKEADGNLVEVFQGLGALIEDSYELNDLKAFATEIEKLYPVEGGGFSFVSAVKKYLPVLVAGKNVLLSDNSSIVGRDQWTPLMTLGGQVLGRWLYYFYFLSADGIDVFHGDGLSSLNSFSAASLKVIDSVLDKKPLNTVSFADIKKLTDAARSTGVLPEKPEAKVVDNLVQTLLSKILIQPQHRISGPAPLGLTREATSVFREEYRIWYEGQKFFEEEVFKGVSPGGTLWGKDILKFFPGSGESSIARNELKVILESPLSRSFDPEGRLVISNQDYPYSLKSTDMLNFSRELSRLVMLSYAGDMSRITKYQGITSAEGSQLYSELKPVLVALNIVDEANTGFPSARFLESNLFTPRANGDDLASFIELTDLVTDITSGIRLDGMIKEKLLSTDPQTGCPIVKTGPTDKDKIEVNCLVNSYAKNLSLVFSSIPNQRDYLAKLPRCRKISENPWLGYPELRAKASAEMRARVTEDNIENYVQACTDSFDTTMVNMLRAVGYKPNDKGTVALGDISLVPHIMQYVEQVIQRFDRNKDGELDTKEGMNSYPIFKKTLSTVSGYSDDKTLKGLLAYFMINGKPPETIWEKAYFYVIFRNQSGSWNIQMDRSKLTAILAYISEAIATKRTKIIGEDPTGETSPNPRKPIQGLGALPEVDQQTIN